MLQTRANLAEDLAATGVDTAAMGQTHTHLFMSVADLDAAERALAGEAWLFDRRDTFYGAAETGFVEPGGHHVVLAQFAANSPDEA